MIFWLLSIDWDTIFFITSFTSLVTNNGILFRQIKHDPDLYKRCYMIIYMFICIPCFGWRYSQLMILRMVALISLKLVWTLRFLWNLMRQFFCQCPCNNLLMIQFLLPVQVFRNSKVNASEHQRNVFSTLLECILFNHTIVCNY